MIQMIYQKANGQIVKRVRNTMAPYKIGDKTSMGWEVLDILYLYNHKYYPKYEYDKLVNKYFLKQKKKEKFVRCFCKLSKQLVYCLSLLILLKAFDLLNKVS